MRVVCQDVNDFLANLDSFQGERLQVYKDLTYELVDEVKVQVILHLTAYLRSIQITMGGQNEWTEPTIVQCDLNCGTDYHEGEEPEREASGVAQKLLLKVEEYCDDNGHKLLPGIIDMS